MCFIYLLLATAGTVDREAETVESTDEASTVPRDEETVARPHLITLRYPPNTHTNFIEKFPKKRVRKPADRIITMGRGVDVDVLLNEKHMPRMFVELGCKVDQQEVPRWYVKNKSDKKPVRIQLNGTGTSLKLGETKEIQDGCQLKLESLMFSVKTEDGDNGDMTEFELEILPEEGDRTHSSSTSSAGLLNRQTSSSSSGNSLTSAAGLAQERAGFRQSGAGLQHTVNHFGLPVQDPLLGVPAPQHVPFLGPTRSAASQASTCSCNFCPPPHHHQCAQQSHAGHIIYHQQTQMPGGIIPQTAPGYAGPGPGPLGYQFAGGGGGPPAFIDPTPYGQPPVLPQACHHPVPVGQPSLPAGVPVAEQMVPSAATRNAEAMPGLLPSQLYNSDPDCQQSHHHHPQYVQPNPQQWQYQQQQQLLNFGGHQQAQPPLPNHLRGPQSLFTQQHTPLSSDMGPTRPVFIAQPESAAMLTTSVQQQQQPENRPSPHTISTPTTQDTNPQLYHASNSDLPAAPPVTQLDRLKLSYPVQVTTHDPTQAAANSLVNSLSDSGSGSWNAAGGGGGGGTHFLQNSTLLPAPELHLTQGAPNSSREAVALGASHAEASAAGSLPPGAEARHRSEGVGHRAVVAPTGNGNTVDTLLAALQTVSASVLPAHQNQGGANRGPPQVFPGGASSSLTQPALNGNQVNLRSHDGIAATPMPSADFSTMGSDRLADLQARDSAEQEDQGSSREPQENDERQPQENEDRWKILSVDYCSERLTTGEKCCQLIIVQKEDRQKVSVDYCLERLVEDNQGLDTVGSC